MALFKMYFSNELKEKKAEFLYYKVLDILFIKNKAAFSLLMEKKTFFLLFKTCFFHQRKKWKVRK